MTVYRMTIEVDVDDEALAAHNGDDQAPPNHIGDWYGTDILAAVERELAEVCQVEVLEIEKA